MKLYFGKRRGRGSHSEVGGGGPHCVSVALLALLQLFRVAVTRLPLRAAAGLGRAAVGGRKWTGDSVSVGFLSDSGLNLFLRVVPGGPMWL